MRRAPRHLAVGVRLCCVLAAAYFLVPLIATLLFSLKSNQTGKCCSLAAWSFVIHDGQFWSTLQDLVASSRSRRSRSACVLFVPTVYWVHLKLPKLRPVMAFCALMPFVVPPIVLVVGLLNLFRGSPELVLRQAVRLPRRRLRDPGVPVHVLRARRGFRAIDVHTLTEASHSLGAGWLTTMCKVILPNIRVAALSGSFLALAIVMGEFTIASLARVLHVPDLHRVHQGDAGVSCGRRGVAQLRRSPGPRCSRCSSIGRGRPRRLVTRRRRR